MPVVAEVRRSGGEHGDGSVDGPVGAGADQTVADDVAAGAFDDSAGNRVAFAQALVVMHAVAVVREVRDRRANGVGRRFREFPSGECLSQTADHSAGVAFQELPQTCGDELPRGRFGVWR